VPDHPLKNTGNIYSRLEAANIHDCLGATDAISTQTSTGSFATFTVCLNNDRVGAAAAIVANFEPLISFVFERPLDDVDLGSIVIDGIVDQFAKRLGPTEVLRGGAEKITWRRAKIRPAIHRAPLSPA
jgi:hypothetical protein